MSEKYEHISPDSRFIEYADDQFKAVDEEQRDRDLGGSGEAPKCLRIWCGKRAAFCPSVLDEDGGYTHYWLCIDHADDVKKTTPAIINHSDYMALKKAGKIRFATEEF